MAFYHENAEFGQNVLTPADFRTRGGAGAVASKQKRAKAAIKAKPVKRTLVKVGAGAVGSSSVQILASAAAVAAGSRVRYVGTFISKTASVIAPGYTIYQRAQIASSKQAVKRAFENAFSDVFVTVSAGGGAIEVDFTVAQDWELSNALRDACDALILSGAGYRPQTSALAITSKGQSIVNSPRDRNATVTRQIQETINSVSEKTADIADNSLTAYAASMGLTTPVAIALGGILLILILKK